MKGRNKHSVKKVNADYEVRYDSEKVSTSPPKSLRERVQEEQRRFERLWLQNPTRLWKSR